MEGIKVSEIEIPFTTTLDGVTNGTLKEIQNLDIRLTTASFVGLTVLYTVTTFLSVSGNILAVIVFARSKRSRTDLRPFLINLAAADLLMAIFCMPFSFAEAIFRVWIFSAPMCTIVVFVQVVSVVSSVLTNMAIGIDRFLVVTFPLKLRFTQKRKKYVISLIWVISVALASVQLFVARGHHIDANTLVCSELWPSEHSRKVYTVVLLLLAYVIPLVILSVTYTVTGLLLWKRTTPGNSHHLRDFLQWRSKIKVVKMLVLVVAMFGVCWLPLHVFNIAIDFYPEMLHYSSAEEERLILGLFLGAHWLAMSNSFANPIIYGFTNDSFRVDLLTLMYKWFPCCICIKDIVTRANSRVTRDSIVFKRHSAIHRSIVTTSSSSKRSKISKRWGSLKLESSLSINKSKESTFTQTKIKEYTDKRKHVMVRRHTVCNIVVSEISEKVTSR